jgi:RimJ/RimL family protein N-acetyltransferase
MGAMTIGEISGRTNRLTIEPLALAHSDALHQALDDPRVGEYIGGPDVTTSDATRRRIEFVIRGAPAESGQMWCNWAVLLHDTVIGRLEATLHDDIAEIAYVFGPRWWGQGRATEATSWMVDMLEAHVAACWATVTPPNTASARLLRRIGFEEAEPAVVLLSYDDGDLTFRKRSPG